MKQLFFSAALFTATLSGNASGDPIAKTDGAITIDADFPSGNIIVAQTEGDTVTLRTDLRDTTGNWFYWHFRASGAAGRTVNFRFDRGNPVGVRGAAVSLDGGMNWKWLGTEGADKTSFTYTFPTTPEKVHFSFAMPYTQRHLDAFLEDHKSNPHLAREVLCQSRKGRAVEKLRLGKIEGTPSARVLITARSHSCEMMMSYAVEGIISAVLADDERGKWFRDHVEMVIIPFVDKDGVEDGDQGKNRAPHDHNRDYDPGGLYPETRALLETIPAWSQGKLDIALDLHCPHIRGRTNEKIYLVGSSSPAMAEAQTAFSTILERVRKGPLEYRAADNIPFGKDWNTAANYKAGTSGSRWSGNLPGTGLAATFELPYANANGGEVNATSARDFGSDLASAMVEQLKSSGQR